MPKTDQGLNNIRYVVVPRTLIFLTSGDSILLLKGAPNKRLWANKYNGIGGHIERGEDVMSSARREFKEETGFDVDLLLLCATIFIDVHETKGVVIFVFRGEDYSGKLLQTDEGQLEWVKITNVYNLPLVEDLKSLLPRILKIKKGESPLSLCYHYNDLDQLKITYGN